MRARGSGCKRRPLHLDAGEETEVEDCQCILLRLCSFSHTKKCKRSQEDGTPPVPKP